MYGMSAGRNGPDYPAVHQTGGLEESMRLIGLLGRELYPERPGLQDCAYYMRTGSCGYGSKCCYNHPRDRSSVGALRIEGGEYPLRLGEPACQYYLKTGTCKFGAFCKFHHPRLAGGTLSNVPVTIHGYPLRPNEKECSYYLKTGQCKFGITCKFHHPQPTDISVPASSHPFYQTVHSPSVPLSDQYGVASTSYRVAKPTTLLPGSYVPGANGTVLLSPGMVPVPNLSPYSVPVDPVLSSGTQASVGAASLYGVTKLSSSAPAYASSYPPLLPSTDPSSSSQTEKAFPERPGQPECQYYMKNGDCKFGSSCRYHHPHWVVSNTNCVLSSVGLPLRPGVQPCTFYLQKGHCKFGRACKFDHPIIGTTVRYSPSASSLTNIPVAPPYALGSSIAPSILFSELRPILISVSKLDPHLSRGVPSTSNTSTSSVGLIYSQMSSLSLSDVHRSTQGSPTSSITSRSTRLCGKVRRSI